MLLPNNDNEQILPKFHKNSAVDDSIKQETQLSPSDRAMRLVSIILSITNLPCNSAETTYTTSPDQTDGIKLEV